MNATEYVFPTRERLEQAQGEWEEFAPDENVHHRAIRMLDGSPLQKLATAGQKAERSGITGDQFNAGVRYFADAYFAGILASGVVDPARERVDGGSFKDLSDFRLAAQTRFNRACRNIGFIHRLVLDDVVLAECPLPVYCDRFREFARHRDRMIAALTALRLALDALDIHYHGHKRSSSTRSAHAPDYRPAIATLNHAVPYDYDD